MIISSRCIVPLLAPSAPVFLQTFSEFILKLLGWEVEPFFATRDAFSRLQYIFIVRIN